MCFFVTVAKTCRVCGLPYKVLESASSCADESCPEAEKYVLLPETGDFYCFHCDFVSNIGLPVGPNALLTPGEKTVILVPKDLFANNPLQGPLTAEQAQRVLQIETETQRAVAERWDYMKGVYDTLRTQIAEKLETLRSAARDLEQAQAQRSDEYQFMLEVASMSPEQHTEAVQLHEKRKTKLVVQFNECAPNDDATRIALRRLLDKNNMRLTMLSWRDTFDQHEPDYDNFRANTRVVELQAASMNDLNTTVTDALNLRYARERAFHVLLPQKRAEEVSRLLLDSERKFREKEESESWSDQFLRSLE
ncbi:hypothetical protein SPI_07990 [Niveomyces insectorum RCEF 264]|uniref:Uncharacterized protein n=1 Tax=Niveomyces insectorum RCEF 264 TaxID=1081102 RepID=A0A167NPV6_9HYPO|nr:hypothetical protein SPI_07990 [Niveomyces insectorum RCEF 264]